MAVFANVVFHNILPSFPMRTVTIGTNFYIPFWRDFLLALGFIDSDRDTLKSLLDKHISIGIVVGGADEALNARPNSADLTLDSRHGFVRLALEHGASLVPVYSFGENDLFTQLIPNPPGSKMRAFQDKMKDIFGYSMPALVPAMPEHRVLHTVVGRPIELPLIEEPTEKEITHWHGLYLDRLETLFNKYQPELAPNTSQGMVFTDRKPVAKL